MKRRVITASVLMLFLSALSLLGAYNLDRAASGHRDECSWGLLRALTGLGNQKVLTFFLLFLLLPAMAVLFMLFEHSYIKYMCQNCRMSGGPVCGVPDNREAVMDYFKLKPGAGKIFAITPKEYLLQTRKEAPYCKQPGIPLLSHAGGGRFERGLYLFPAVCPAGCRAHDCRGAAVRLHGAHRHPI